MINQHQTIKDNIAKYNKRRPFAEHLLQYVEGIKEIHVLDIGSGPYSVIGNEIKGADFTMFLADNQDFSNFWRKYKAYPAFKVEYQDMERLQYRDNFFDLVHCANALDHTRDALSAVKEMIRVCKPGGWVYIDCHLDQLDTGHKHKWNVKNNGLLTNNKEKFNLRDFGFSVNFISNGGESRYDRIVATLQK